MSANKFDLLIVNARLFTPQGAVQGALGVRAGRVSELGSQLSGSADVRVDAGGRWLLPGAVDAHTHLSLRSGAFSTCDGWERGSAAALGGGCTTVLEHISFGSAPAEEKILCAQVLASADCHCDYVIHGVVQDGDLTPELPATLARLRLAGVGSWKAYTTYDHAIDSDALRQLLVWTRAAGVLLVLHCEDDALLRERRAEADARGWRSPMFHPYRRPAQAEAKAVRQALDAARQAGHAPLYLAHISTSAALREIRAARRSGQKNIFVETCPQYLFLDESAYAALPEQAVLSLLCPPLRPVYPDQAALWQALGDGTVDVIATDHCAFSVPDKLRGTDDCAAAPQGAPGVADRLPLLLAAALEQRLSPERVVELCCSAPARIFGLESKGRLEAGADADLVLFDPSAQPRHSLPPGQPYSLLDQQISRGRIDRVWRRGRLLWQGGELADSSRGQLLSV